MTLKELWQCPNCGEKFTSKNMWHSCGKFSLEALFARSEPRVFQLYKRFEQFVRSVGPVTVIPQKTRVVFQVRMRFAGAVPRKSYLLCHFIFSRRHDNPRFSKVNQYGPQSYEHLIRVEKMGDFDEEFVGWIREAYEVGEQKHLQLTTKVAQTGTPD
jgi:hypothetical protein